MCLSWKVWQYFTQTFSRNPNAYTCIGCSNSDTGLAFKSPRWDPNFVFGLAVGLANLSGRPTVPCYLNIYALAPGRKDCYMYAFDTETNAWLELKGACSELYRDRP